MFFSPKQQSPLKHMGQAPSSLHNVAKYSFQFWIAESVRHGPDGNCSPDTQQKHGEKIFLFFFS
jgi:hypothetical protein